nr:response regulator [candidate division Zixibacteria bacterium]
MERKINTLVVDDEQIVLDSIRKLLKRDNYEVFTALSVAAALEQLKEHKIDVILTDLMMPEIDGLEFMEMVRKDHPYLPVVMITGYATINTALQATQLGAFDYIAKPFSKKELLGVLQRAAKLVLAADSPDGGNGNGKINGGPVDRIKTIGDHSWMMLLEDGIVLLGVEGAFIQMIGKIQTIYLPSPGDELRQGGSYLQIFSADMRSHSILSPLSGTVVEVNQKVLDDPVSALQDPYDEGWLIRLKPSRFEQEIKLLGL